MIKLNKSIGRQEVDFLFEKGKYKNERYSGRYQVCSNPVCTCRVVDFDLYGKQTNKYGARQHYFFSVDIARRKLTGRVIDEQDFAKSFINELSNEDWISFHQMYYEYKVYCTKHTPIEEIEAEFSMAEEIELSGLTVSYSEILPYSQELFLKIAEEKYLIDLQYCVDVNCKCQGAILSFIPAGADKMFDADADSCFPERSILLTPFRKIVTMFTYLTNKIKTINRACLDVYLDYQNEIWETKFCKGIKVTPDVLLEEVFRQGLHKTIKERHAQLRTLYRKFRGKRLQSLEQESKQVISNVLKVGRNELCPCGSGKKYKKCCLKN